MKKLKTLKLEDQGQDFLSVDIMENGVMLGYSPMFSDNKLTLLGIGALNGEDYYTFKELKKEKFKQDLKNLYLYIKETDEKDPLPWEALTLNYKIIN